MSSHSSFKIKNDMCVDTTLSDSPISIKNIVSATEGDKNNINYCNLQEYLSLRKFQEKNSASDSVIVSGELFNKPELSAFVKIFYKENTKYTQMGMCEVEIYRNVINPLLINHNTPHVMPFLGITECKNFSLETMEPKDELYERLSYLKKQVKELYTTGDTTGTNTLYMLFTEKSEGKSLRDLLMNTPIDIPLLKTILYALIWSIMCFEDVKLLHDDLHLGNIFIEKLKSPKKFTYELMVNGKKVLYEYISDANPKIYDFDYATKESSPYNECEIINRDIDRWHCRRIGVCKEFRKYIDLFKILNEIRIYIHKYNANKHLKIFYNSFIVEGFKNKDILSNVSIKDYKLLGEESKLKYKYVFAHQSLPCLYSPEGKDGCSIVDLEKYLKSPEWWISNLFSEFKVNATTNDIIYRRPSDETIITLHTTSDLSREKSSDKSNLEFSPSYTNLDQKQIDLNNKLLKEALANNYKGVKHLIELGADNYNAVLKEIYVNKMETKIDDKIQKILSSYSYGQSQMYDMMDSRNIDDIAEDYIQNGNNERIVLSMNFGADLDLIMSRCAEFDNIEMIKIAKLRGATNFNDALISAVFWDNKESARLLLEYGATNIDEAIELANDKKFYDLAEFIDRITLKNEIY